MVDAGDELLGLINLPWRVLGGGGFDFFSPEMDCLCESERISSASDVGVSCDVRGRDSVDGRDPAVVSALLILLLSLASPESK